MNIGEIYRITNKINGKQYIGQTIKISSNGKIRGTIKRWKEHVQNARNKICECRLLENAIIKQGKENFMIDILFECTIDKLNFYEDKYIKEYNTLVPLGYNLMTGGGNGRLHSQETKNKMSITRTGKKHSDITKERISNSNKNKIIDEDSRKKISSSSKYRGMSDENKKILIKALSVLKLDDLPIYIRYSIDKRIMNYGLRNVDKISVCIPKQKIKTFGHKDMPLSKKIELAIQYKKNFCTSTVIGLKGRHTLMKA